MGSWGVALAIWGLSGIAALCGALSWAGEAMPNAHCDGWGGLSSTLAMGLPRAGGKAAQAGRHLYLHQRGDWGGSSVSLHNVQGSVAQPLQPGKNQ